MLRYKNSTHIIDNFFKNTQTVIDLGNTLKYYNDEAWPGLRTENLLEINNPLVVEFAKYFAKRIADEVFYGLKQFKIDIRFHKNEVYDVDEANYGWIHNDDIDFAGLVYLNDEEPNMSTGTSIFDKIVSKDFEVQDYESRKELNFKKNVTEQYLKDLRDNRSQFTETINVGNKFNRLVAYDAEQWHRPNSYNVKTLPRYSLLFFINDAQFEDLPSILSVKSNWSDT
jgi:hypothetical protein